MTEPLVSGATAWKLAFCALMLVVIACMGIFSDDGESDRRDPNAPYGEAYDRDGVYKGDRSDEQKAFDRIFEREARRADEEYRDNHPDWDRAHPR